MTSSRDSGPGRGGEVLVGEVLAGGRRPGPGDVLGAAGLRGRQGLEVLTRAVRGVGRALRVSAVAGGVAALVMAGVLEAGFGLGWVPALVLLVVLALPALEVLVHRAVLLRTWGDPARLERRVHDVPAQAMGSLDDFSRRMTNLRPGAGGRGARGVFSSARSAFALRDAAGAAPQLAGALLFPLTRGLLVLTAWATALCWALLLLGVPVAAVASLIAAIAR